MDQVIPLKEATVLLKGATALLKGAAETKLLAPPQEVARTTEERRFKLQDPLPKAQIMVPVEETIVEEEVCQIDLKPTIRVGKGIVFKQRIAVSAAIFLINTKAG